MVQLKEYLLPIILTIIIGACTDSNNAEESRLSLKGEQIKVTQGGSVCRRFPCGNGFYDCVFIIRQKRECQSLQKRRLHNLRKLHNPSQRTQRERDQFCVAKIHRQEYNGL